MANLKMTWVKSRSYRGFKKIINGKPFYLGSEREQAEVKLLKLLLAEKTGGGEGEAVEASLSLSEAVEGFCGHVQARPISTTWKQGLAYRVRRAATYRPDMPLTRLDRPTLAAWVEKIIADSKQSPQSRSNLVRALRQFIAWLDDSERWSVAGWERLFRLRGNVRRDRGKRIKMLTMDQWRSLYREASPRMRCYMLVSLNCGFTQSDLATLRRDHVDFDKGRIERSRQKTGVSGSWLLWKPTLEAVREHMESEGELAFLTERGTPLLRYTSDNRIDTLRLPWVRIAKLAGIPKGYGWKSFRKLGAQLVCEAADVDAAQLYLAHRGQSVAHLHYLNPVSEKLDKALQVVGMKVENALEDGL